MRKLMAVLMILAMIFASSAAAADETDSRYTVLNRNKAPDSWRGEVRVEKGILDEGYQLGMQLLNQDFEKIYPAELNYSRDALYLQLMNVTEEPCDIQLSIYVDGAATGFACSGDKVQALELQLPQMSYDVYEVGDFWPDDGKDHSIYFHVIYGNGMFNNTDKYHMPFCMGYCLTSVSDEYAMNNLDIRGDHVVNISSIKGAKPFGNATQVFLATPETQFGGYHVPSIAENGGTGSIRIIGTGVPGAYGVTLFVDETIAKTYQFCLGEGKVFVIEEEIACKRGDKMMAVIVPLDTDTKMASVSTVVRVVKGGA